MNSKYINRKALQAVALFFGLAFTACSTEDEFTPPTFTKSHTVTITATQPSQDAASRMGYNDKGNGYWQDGDQITVVSEYGSTKSFSTFSMTEGAGTNSAKFTGYINGTRLAYALYPANANHGTDEDDELSYCLPASYTYTTVNKDYPVVDGASFNMPMMATIDQDVTDNSETAIAFKSIGGVLAVKIDRLPAAEGTVSVSAEQDICGNTTIDTNESALGQTFTNGGKTVTFNYSGGDFMQSGVFYLPLPAGDYTNLTVVVAGTSPNGLDLKSTKTATATISITKGHIKRLKVNTDYTYYYSTDEYNSNMFVDLGLPSGLLWSSGNVGTSDPTNAGLFFAWGEVSGKYKDFNISNYIFYVDGKITKYNDNDHLVTLQAGDDAASYGIYDKLLPSNSRIPTADEWATLIQYCTSSTTNIDGNNLFMITSTVNGNSIYLPVVGYYQDSQRIDDESVGYYWSSSLSNSSIQDAQIMKFDYQGGTWSLSSMGRPYGCSIRPVLQP